MFVAYLDIIVYLKLPIIMRQLKITKSITNRESASFDKYLHEIGKYDLLTADEEVELAKRIREGDQRALDKLTRCNLRFVVSVAKQYQNQGMSLSDLINEGNLGLIKAAKRFDETRGFKFISYAVWWIRQSIMQSINDQSRIVRLPLNQVTSFSKYQKASLLFEQENERLPLLEEVAEIIEIPSERIAETLQSSSKHASFDAPFQSDSESGTLLDIVENTQSPSTDYGLMEESLCTEIDRVFASLSERESTVLRLIFGIGLPETSIDDIGERFGLTRERVRQIKEKALLRLRMSDQSKLLRSFLG